MSPRIPATIVTGFLGAGKTSLLRHLAATVGARRLALIINEFGDLGIDRELVRGCGVAECGEDDIIELTNGCLCCTVADEFLPTLTRLLARPVPPDHIVIETSGLALPKPLVKAFTWPEVRTRVTVDGVVAVVDGAAVAAGRFGPAPARLATVRTSVPGPAMPDHDNPLEEVFHDQLACADLVALNKTDLIGADARGHVYAEINRHLRPAVKVVTAVHGRLDPRVLLGLGAGAEADLAARPCRHDAEADAAGADHDHDDFTSFTVALPTVGDPAALEQRLRLASEQHDILRLKGFVAVDGKPLRLVIQGVGQRFERYFDRPWPVGVERRSTLVVIGRRGLDRDAVTAALCSDGSR